MSLFLKQFTWALFVALAALVVGNLMLNTILNLIG